ncbi:MAG: DUF1905 domain-containing protein [Phycicoccus sp.]
MQLEFAGTVVHWRGPAPHHVVAVAEPEVDRIAEMAPLVTYGWGVVPVTVRLGGTCWSTSLVPKDGGYLVPLRLDVRRAEQVGIGDVVRLALALGI